MSQHGNRYCAFGGRVFCVEQSRATLRWSAVGHQRGHAPYVLDKLGCRETREQMQAALDGWAARQGLRPLAERPQGALAGAGAGVAAQAELWVTR